MIFFLYLHAVRTGSPAKDLRHKLLPRGSLADAVEAGKVTTATIDRALGRSLTARMRLGIFDPPASCGEFSELSIEDIGAKNVAHSAALRSAAAQSFVLLRNQERTLPLKAGTNMAVLGPHAITRAGLLSDYAGDSWCWAPKYDGSHKNASCIPRWVEWLVLLWPIISVVSPHSPVIFSFYINDQLTTFLSQLYSLYFLALQR